MFKLKLIKGRSYRGDVVATSEKPFVTVKTEEEAKRLETGGFFAIVSEPEPKAEEVDQEDFIQYDDEVDEEEPRDVLAEELGQMDIAGLKAYAERSGIDIGTRRKKADILKFILKEVAKADEARAVLRNA